LNTLEYSKFKSLLRRVIAIPLVIMAVLAGLLLWETIDLNKSLRSVDHTDQVLDQTGHLLKMLVDIETSMRGYLATGDESLLQPYREGTQQFDSEYRTLYRLLDDNPPQKLQLEDFRAGYERWVGYTDEVIALRRAGKADGAIYESLPGKRGMDALRERISEFQGVEERVRVQRLRTAHARWTLMFTSCLGLGLGFGVFLILFIRYHVERLGTKLLRSEERWSATLDSIGDAVIATNDKARVTFLNPVAAALTGWQAEEALHQPLPHVFKIVNEETGLGADDEVLRVLEERQIFSVTNNVVLIAKDGREIPVEHSAAPILAGKGKVIGVVLVFRDVTERIAGLAEGTTPGAGGTPAVGARRGSQTGRSRPARSDRPDFDGDQNGHDLDDSSSSGVGSRGAPSTAGIDSVNQRWRQIGAHHMQRLASGCVGRPGTGGSH